VNREYIEEGDVCRCECYCEDALLLSTVSVISTKGTWLGTAFRNPVLKCSLLLIISEFINHGKVKSQ